MSLLPRLPAHGGDDPEPTALTLDVHEEERRAYGVADGVRWRAGALAEAIFGHGVVPRLRYARGAAGFHALVELVVPFRDLEEHRDREALFAAEAGRDEILSRSPALFVLTPAPLPEGGP